MYTSFSIQKFRRFKQLKIESLTRCNLITGLNNSGKSTLLEALWMHTGPNRPDLALRILQFRGVPGADVENIARDLFFDFDTREPIELAADGDWGEHPRVLTIATRPKPASVVPFSCTGQWSNKHQLPGDGDNIPIGYRTYPVLSRRESKNL